MWMNGGMPVLVSVHQGLGGMDLCPLAMGELGLWIASLQQGWFQALQLEVNSEDMPSPCPSPLGIKTLFLPSATEV